MTKRSRAFASVGGVAAGLAIILAACQVLVPGTVPDFQCAGADSTSCPAGLVCDTATSKCVATVSQGEGGPDQPDVENPETGPSISGLGGPCAKDPDCKSGLFCGNSTILSIKTDPACTKACCTSNDCDPGFVCYASGTGSYCVTAKLVDRHPPQAGGAPPGASCANDGECRSGQCNGQRCLDTCCNDTACTNGTICGIPSGGVGGHQAWACVLPNAGGLGLQQTCTNPSDCANGACETGVIPNKRCTAPCCTAADCTAAGFPDNACSYATPLGNDQLRFCMDHSNVGIKPEGADCQSDGDCATHFCDFNRPPVCLRACCTSADCNAGESCRPSDGTIRLRCVKST